MSRIVVAGALALAMPGVASAREPRSTYDPAALTAGGAAASQPASVRGVECRSGCQALDRAAPGGHVRVRGRAMHDVRRVVLLGGTGASDDVVAPARNASGTKVDVRVPAGARSGPVAVLNADGAASSPSSRRLKISGPRQRSGTGVKAAVVRRRVVLGGAPQRLRVLVTGSQRQTVRVALMRRGARRVARTWTLRNVVPGVPREIRWRAKGRRGRPPATGRYEFRATLRGARAAASTSVAVAFRFVSAVFPIRAAHTYEDGFGGARGHQGFDVFARCGAPLVAVLSGRIQKVDFQGAAGNYVVLDPDNDGRDFVYMHLRERAPVQVGQRIAAGDPIGTVGQTGRASGCHLHFEQWTAPGYYEGGRPVDAGPQLRAWDKIS